MPTLPVSFMVTFSPDLVANPSSEVGPAAAALVHRAVIFPINRPVVPASSSPSKRKLEPHPAATVPLLKRAAVNKSITSLVPLVEFEDVTPFPDTVVLNINPEPLPTAVKELLPIEFERQVV